MLDIERITLTTLSENSVADIYYMGEWGLSIHVSIEGGPTILFDTGFKYACTYNAEVAGIRLSEIDLIALSHGHTDHTGGLRRVLEKIQFEAPGREYVDVYCHPEAIEAQHVKHTDHYFYRGCPFHIEELKRLGARFKTSTRPVWITDDIVVSGEIPMRTDFEAVAPICFLKHGEDYVPSPVTDDQALFLITAKGLIVVSGCAHRGIINTLLQAQAVTGVEDIYMIVGGTHLLNTSAAQQKKTLEAFKEHGVKKIGVSHCTGMQPAAFLAHELGPNRFFFNNAGAKITFSGDSVNIKSFENYDL